MEYIRFLNFIDLKNFVGKTIMLDVPFKDESAQNAIDLRILTAVDSREKLILSRLRTEMNTYATNDAIYNYGDTSHDVVLAQVVDSNHLIRILSQWSGIKIFYTSSPNIYKFMVPLPANKSYERLMKRFGLLFSYSPIDVSTLHEVLNNKVIGYNEYLGGPRLPVVNVIQTTPSVSNWFEYIQQARLQRLVRRLDREDDRRIIRRERERERREEEREKKDTERERDRLRDRVKTLEEAAMRRAREVLRRHIRRKRAATGP